MLAALCPGRGGAAALVAVACAVAALPAAAAAKPKRADLVSGAPTIPATASPGGPVAVRVVVRNAGGARAGASSLALTLSTDRKPDARDRALGAGAVGKLAARKSATVALRGVVPATLTPGRYYVIACADAARKVREAKETNNCSASARPLDIAASAARPGPIVTAPQRPAAPQPPAPQPIATPPTSTGPASPPTTTGTTTVTPPPPPPDTTAPRVSITGGPGAVTQERTATLTFSADEAATFACRLDETGAFAPCTSPARYPELPLGPHVFEVRATDAAGNVSPVASRAWDLTAPAPVVGPRDAPAPDPATKADAPKAGAAPSVGEQTAFLYEGPAPLQSGVAAGAIDEDRAGVVRGVVANRMGGGIGGVRVTVLDRPELGRTATRPDGGFDLAVNGGDTLTLVFERQGYLPAQRQVVSDAGVFERADDVVLVPMDPAVTEVEQGSSEPFQVVQGTEVGSGDEQRQATLLFAAGTDGTMVMPDGSSRPLEEDLAVRATEYTQGERGEAAMPGELPPTSAYTYAVEFSVDEAVSEGAASVEFDKPVTTYVEDIVGMPAGTPVPSGYYDRERGAWVPAPDGVALDVVGKQDGLAQVDVTGDGRADTGAALERIGITAAELRRLAGLYDVGADLWRVQVSHFTPWDYNFPYGPPDDARPPSPKPPRPKVGPEDPCARGGSTIGCEKQTLGEAVDLPGTSFSLVYSSDRAPGYRAAYDLDVPVADASTPASVLRAEVEVTVAGRTVRHVVPKSELVPGAKWTFRWDGVDAYGRQVVGEQPVTTRVTYVYPLAYRTPAEFGRSFAQLGTSLVVGTRGRSELSSTVEWQGTIGSLAVPPSAVGGWSIDVHHVYDAKARTLFAGDGSTRSAEGQGFDTIRTLVGAAASRPEVIQPLDFPQSVAVAPDGTVLIADTGSDVVRRITPDGRSVVLAGTGVAGFGGDGGPATAAQLDGPTDVAVAPDGAVLIVDRGNERLRRVASDGTIATIAGNGEAGFAGDGGPAAAARLDEPSDVAAAPDGSVYLVDRGNHALRRIGTDGRIATIAGNGSPGAGPEQGLAARSRLNRPDDVLVDGDGALLVADAGNHRVRRIDPDGRVSTIAGTGEVGGTGDGGPATAAKLREPTGLARDPQGRLLIADAGDGRVRRVTTDGTIQAFVGDGVAGIGGDGGTAAAARLDSPTAIVTGPAGTLIADPGVGRVRVVEPGLPGVVDVGEQLIPDEEGGTVDVFDRSGRHVRTVNAFTGHTVVSFGYDAGGLLTTITQPHGDRTTIERAADGTPTRVVGPTGLATQLTVRNGLLRRVEQADGLGVDLTYDASGLLTGYDAPGPGASSFAYDEAGRLVRDTSPDGSSQTLAGSALANGDRVTVTDQPGGKETTYDRIDLGDGRVRRRVTEPGGRVTTADSAPDGSVTLTGPDGTVSVTRVGPDPRFGMRAPVIVESSITLRDGRVLRKITGGREVELSDPRSPLAVRRIRQFVNVAGGVAEVVYDRATNTFTKRAPGGRTTSVRVDASGEAVETVTGRDRVLTEFDAGGNPVRQGREGAMETLRYDERGLLSSVTDALGRTGTRKTDVMGRPTEMTFEGATTKLGYDATGLLTSVTPPGRPAHTFTRDADGLVSAWTMPDVPTAAGGPLRTTYEDDGAVATTTRPDGTLVTFHRDALGRQTGWTQPRGRTTFAFGGGADDDRPVSISGPGGERTDLEWGSDGLLAGTTQAGTAGGRVRFGYDADAAMVSMTYGGATVGYDHDAEGRPTRIDDAEDLTLGYDAVTGRPTSVVQGTVDDRIRADDTGGHAETLVQRSGSTLLRVVSTRDAAGRATRRVETVGGTTTTYDYTYAPRGELATVTKDGRPWRSYAWGTNGTRTSATEDGTERQATYDARDRLLTDGAATVVHDASGDVVSRTDATGTTTYRHDAIGGLERVGLPDGRTVTYDLDGLSRRVGKRVDGRLQRGFVYAGTGALVLETGADDQVVSRFVYGADPAVPLAMVRGGRTYRLVRDELGSVRLVVDVASGEVAQRLDFDPFGRVLQDTNPGFQPWGYAGGISDPDTGLVRMGVRDYEPRTGTFLTLDPVGFEGDDTNLYRAVGGDPVNRTDLSGLAPPRVDGAAVAETGASLLGNLKTSGAGGLTTSAFAGDPIAQSVARGAAATALGTTTTIGLEAIAGVMVATGVGAPLGAPLAVAAPFIGSGVGEFYNQFLPGGDGAKGNYGTAIANIALSTALTKGGALAAKGVGKLAGEFGGRGLSYAKGAAEGLVGTAGMWAGGQAISAAGKLTPPAGLAPTPRPGPPSGGGSAIPGPKTPAGRPKGPPRGPSRPGPKNPKRSPPRSCPVKR
jgi:RHS repeat-associated protein